MDRKRWKVTLMQSFKIGVGSSVAIYVAELFNLQFAASAGGIALLTIVATKLDTFKLSLYRIVTFVFSIILAYFCFSIFSIEWVEYGVFVFAMVMLCEAFGWKSAISVNAVIGTHFLSTRDFSKNFILNELMLILIGISIAIVLNLFHNNGGRRKEIIQNMHYTEQQLQRILDEVAEYLSDRKLKLDVWNELRHLESELQGFIYDAYAHQNNIFFSDPEYYIDYFEMRMSQCHLLHNLHNEMRKIRQMPKQAKRIAEYIRYMSGYVKERKVPQEQMEHLEEISEIMKREPLPTDIEEFESRAILYHILMDLDEFLMYKKQFVEGLSEKQLSRYWEQK